LAILNSDPILCSVKSSLPLISSNEGGNGEMVRPKGQSKPEAKAEESGEKQKIVASLFSVNYTKTLA
jgi:hypothetical protein